MKRIIPGETIVLLLIAVSGYFIVTVLLQLFENASSNNYIPSDAESYYNAASYLYQHNFKSHPTRPMGYPLMIGLPLLFNLNQADLHYWVYGVNVTAWILTVLLVFKTVRMVTNIHWGFGAAILFSLNIGNIGISNQALTETVYTLTITAICYHVFKYLMHKHTHHRVLAFLLLCISIIIRPAGIFLLPIGLLLVIPPFLRLPARSSLKHVFMVLLGLSLVNIQMCLIKMDYGNYTISYNGKLALYLYIGAFAENLKTGTPVNTIKSGRYHGLFSGTDVDWLQINQLANDDFKDQVFNNTSNVLQAFKINLMMNAMGRSSGICMAQNLRQRDRFDQIKRTFCSISRYQNTLYSMSIIGGLLLSLILWRKIPPEIITGIWVCSGIAIYIVLISAFSYWQGDRFHIVIVPLMLINLTLIAFYGVKSFVRQFTG